ncbi:STM4504/CBY_0614 family protein, partial [Bathymodiolus azoricus thioautotrophic gill symbiont]|uniref:STM4504/CBY_0614 family protein n=1 Tax=Bathymodiolus azoricus thioautotrophic gill symbiont TaxID=235205 RepID=UPI000AAFC1D9
HGIGFQFIENEIIRIDSELIHEEAVKPALRLLNGENYQGAQQEFLSAYDHYRHGKNKDSLNECLKAFESTMKAICEKNNWDYQANATVKSLIQICFDNNLVPSFWQQQLDSLRSLLESGIPTGRNKLSAHGQGTTPTVVPGYLVAYMLHMTASTLVFLITAEREMHNK